MTLRLDEATHTYWDSDVPIPGVNEIIAAAGLGVDFRHVADGVLEQARARGTLVHEAVQAVDEGNLLLSEVRAAAGGYLCAYERFLVETGYRMEACEVTLYSRRYGYAGRPDTIGLLHGRRRLIDVKTPLVIDAVSVHPAQAAYEQAWTETHPELPIDACATLQLREDGTYRLRALATERPWRVFVYALEAFAGRSTPDQLAELADWKRDCGRAS